MAQRTRWLEWKKMWPIKSGRRKKYEDGKCWNRDAEKLDQQKTKRQCHRAKKWDQKAWGPDKTYQDAEHPEDCTNLKSIQKKTSIAKWEVRKKYDK